MRHGCLAEDRLNVCVSIPRYPAATSSHNVGGAVHARRGLARAEQSVKIRADRSRTV